VRGRTLVQRTGAGKQGVVAAADADDLLLGSLVVAGATAEVIRRRAPRRVSLVAMCREGAPPSEDDACADYIAWLLMAEGRHDGRQRKIEEVVAAVPASGDAQELMTPDDPDFPTSDLDLAVAVDRFAFTMPVTREGDLLVARRVDVV
jgi:2-phosphosulfolactate phosphatase